MKVGINRSARDWRVHNMGVYSIEFGGRYEWMDWSVSNIFLNKRVGMAFKTWWHSTSLLEVGTRQK